MKTQIAQLGYETKSTGYFQWARSEMLRFVPTNCRRVLDVGCAEGIFGELLKRDRNVEVWGVEPVRSAAQKAMPRLDRVIESSFGPENPLPAKSFDCVLFNDVLEHMLAPEQALRYARSLLAPGGVVVASLPNIRSFPTIWRLLVHASWEYMDCGVLDKTHLRFFTRSSIVGMFESEAYHLQGVYGLNAYCGVPNASRRLWTAYRVANALFLRKFDDMKFQQFAVVAKPVADADSIQSDTSISTSGTFARRR